VAFNPLDNLLEQIDRFAPSGVALQVEDEKKAKNREYPSFLRISHHAHNRNGRTKYR
jgi:hypothetical protein